MDDGRNDRAKERSTSGRHQHAVFIGPTKRQIDASWLATEGDKVESGEELLQWKVSRYWASVERDGRSAFLASIRSRKGRVLQTAEDRQPDPLIEIRKRSVARQEDVSAGRRDKTNDVAPASPSEEELEGSHDTNASDNFSRAVNYDGERESPSLVASEPSLVLSTPQDSCPLTIPELDLESNQSGFRSVAPSEQDTSSIAQEIVSVPQPLPRSSRLQLGPARRIGISRLDKGSRQEPLEKPPFLRLLKGKRDARQTVEDQSTLAQVSRKDTHSEPQEEASVDASIIRGLSTTFDSIPPPPNHAFSLSTLTPLSTLLESPLEFLPTLQGGNDDANRPFVNILALIHSVGPVDEVRNWKSKQGATMARCEVIVQDGLANSLRVIVEGDCAERWCMERDGLQSVSLLTDKKNTLVSARRFSEESESTTVTTRLIGDASCASRSDRTFSKRTILPLQRGDVVALTNVRITRSNPSKALQSKDPQRKQSGSTSDRYPSASVASELYARATDEHHSAVEVCWRSESEDESQYDSVNFDPALTAFDARCRAIYALAVTWNVSV